MSRFIAEIPDEILEKRGSHAMPEEHTSHKTHHRFDEEQFDQFLSGEIDADQLLG